MAKNIIIASLNIIVTFFLIFLCTFSSSTRTPFESSEINNVDVNVNGIDQTNQDSSFPMSVKNPLDQNSIFLPSENLPESDSQPTLIQYEPDEETTNHESKIDAPTKTITTTTESLEESKPLPLTVFRFGPIDRSRIPRRPLPLSHRRPFHHRCHHTHHHYKPWNNRHLPHRAKNVVITKINDDIEFDTLARGGARQTPVDWMRYDNININDPIMFSRERSKAMEKSELLRRIYERYNQRRQEKVEAKNKENGSTFVKRIRKFLNGK